jgi:hypothetical protein
MLSCVVGTSRYQEITVFVGSRDICAKSLDKEKTDGASPERCNAQEQPLEIGTYPEVDDRHPRRTRSTRRSPWRWPN